MLYGFTAANHTIHPIPSIVVVLLRTPRGGLHPRSITQFKEGFTVFGRSLSERALADRNFCKFKWRVLIRQSWLVLLGFKLALQIIIILLFSLVHHLLVDNKRKFFTSILCNLRYVVTLNVSEGLSEQGT